MWLIPLAVLCHWNSRRKRSIFRAMLLYGFISNYGNIFFRVVLVFHYECYRGDIFSTSINIKQRSVLWIYILTILLMDIILWGLMEWTLSLSTIILGGTGYFLLTTILSWIIFRTVAWLAIYKNTGIFLSILLLEKNVLCMKNIRLKIWLIWM